jgi:hypothetical protein
MNLVERVTNLMSRTPDKCAGYVTLLLALSRSIIGRIALGIAIIRKRSTSLAGNTDGVVHDTPIRKKNLFSVVKKRNIMIV